MADQPRSSRQRYRRFVQDYKHGRLDDATQPDAGLTQPGDPARRDEDKERRSKRRR